MMTGGGIRTGETVAVRGTAWTVHNVTVWSDCASLDLIPRHMGRSPRTLMLPFDRPRRIGVPATRRTVRIRRALHALRELHASMVPLGGLRTLAESDVRLLPHQLAPAIAILRHGETRVLIADAVGLGKTIQAGIVVRELQARMHELRALLLVPAGLRHQWGQELETHFGLHATHASSDWLREVARDRPPDVNPWSLPGVYLASHDFVKRPEVLLALEHVRWDVVVVDEAHAATIRSDRRIAIDGIARRSRRLLLLTATPHAGDPREFDALCSLGRIDPSEPPVLMFQRTRAELAGTLRRRTRFLKIEPTSAEERMHDLLDQYTRLIWREASGRGDAGAQLVAIVLKKRALSSASALAASATRRLRLLSIPASAPSLQMRLPLDEEPLADEDPDSVLAAPGLSDPRREARWLATVVEAARRAASSESKMRRLRTLVRRVREPLIVFSEYRDTLRMLELAFRTDARQLVVLHGGMDPAERADVQRRFNEGGSLLLATDAAAEGLNLHHRCRLVVHYELPWSPARLEQRTGRVDRLGQTRRVHEVALVSGIAAERLVLAPLAARLAKAATVAQSSAALLASVNESSVGRMIMASAPVAVDPPAAPPLTTVRVADRHDEALDECRRLEERRRWLWTAAGRRAHRAVRSCRRGAGPRRDLSFVVSLTLVDASGGVIHGEAIVLRTTAVEHPSGNRREDLRRADAIWSSDEGVQRVLDALLEELTARAGGDYAASTAALRIRETAMARATAPGARELVQAGLFDHRLVGSARSRSLLGDALGEHPDGQSAQQGAGAPLEAIAALRGVIVGRRQGATA